MVELAGVGLLRAVGEQLQVGAVRLGDDRQVLGRPGGGSVGQRPLDDAVLQGLVGLHHQAPSHAQAVESPGHGPLQDVELGVDGDAQRLEGPFGRVPAAAACRRGHGLTDELGHVLGTGHRIPGLAAAHDGGGDAGGEALLAVGAQNAGELGGVGMRQQVLGGHS